MVREPSVRVVGKAPRRPWWSRLSRAHLAVVGTAVVAATLNLAALRQGPQQVLVLVAAHDLPPGAPLSSEDLRAVALSGDRDTLDALLPGDGGTEHAGWLLARGLRRGEPLRWSDLLPPAAAGLRSMSIPVEPEQAVAGTLRSGDLVDVASVRDGSAEWVLAAARVVAVAEPEAGGGLTAGGTYSLTVLVEPDAALRLALALREGRVVVVRSTGAVPLQLEVSEPAPGEQPR